MGGLAATISDATPLRVSGKIFWDDHPQQPIPQPYSTVCPHHVPFISVLHTNETTGKTAYSPLKPITWALLDDIISGPSLSMDACRTGAKE